MRSAVGVAQGTRVPAIGFHLAGASRVHPREVRAATTIFVHHRFEASRDPFTGWPLLSAASTADSLSSHPSSVKRLTLDRVADAAIAAGLKSSRDLALPATRIDSMAEQPQRSEDRRRADRARWPVTRFRLGEEPPDDLSATTTATERIAMMRVLAESAWRLSGRPWPAYDRRNIPARIFRPGERPPDDDDS